MRKVILLSQLISMSMLFAPRDSRDRASIASRETLSSPSRSLPSSPSREVLSIDDLDCAMFKHWYGDCFKTKEIDGVSYFIELPERETKSPFVLLGMSPYIQVSSLSVSVVENNFSSKHAPIFNTSNERPIRFKYTINQKVQFGEAKDIFDTIVPKAKQMMQDMLDELNDAYRYGYKSHLPLDSIEVQDESGNIYLICGIEQSSAKNYWISEPESIRIKIKASKQCPESRMSRKHLLAQVSVPTSCPEFYMSRRYLGMYHAIYSALNEELVESLKGISKFPKVEGYSQIPDSLQTQEWFNKAQETIEYLKENELEPSVYIPTYQHDILAEGASKDEDYGSLVFTCHDEKYGVFKTEVVNDLQYTLHLDSCEMKEAGLGDTFRLSDLIGKEIHSYYLEVSLFCPAPGKFKQSSGNTEFRYRYSLEYDEESESIDAFKNAESIADAFKNALQEAKTTRDKIIGKLSEIKSVDFPLAMIETDAREAEPQTIRAISSLIPSDEGNKLNPKFAGSEGPKLDISWIAVEEDITWIAAEEFLIEEHLIACRDVCKLVRTGIHKLLKGVTEFSDEEDYVRLPEVVKKQSFWTEAEALLKKVDNHVSVEIPCYLHNALIDKQHEFLPFTREFTRDKNVFQAECGWQTYSLTLSDTSGLGDTCKLSDLADKKITNLWVIYGGNEYNINKTIPGNEVSEQFKIASQTLRKLRCASGVDRAIVNISDECIEIEVFSSGKRLSSKCATFQRPKLKIILRNDIILQKFLTKERLKICNDVFKLLTRKIRKLLKDVTEFSDEEDYVDMPKLFRKQSFWPRAEALINEISDDVSISIPRYIHDALTDILPEACDASSDSDDESSYSEYDQQA